MIVIACSTGIRSTQPLRVACQLIADLGFAYVDPLAIEGWHVPPSDLLNDPARQTERVRATLERHGLPLRAPEPAWPPRDARAKTIRGEC